MKSKVEFYNAFFKTLNEKGFTVEEPSSPDYLVDIRHRGKIIAFYTKGDVIMKNPFEEAQDKLLERIEQLALATADVCRSALRGGESTKAGEWCGENQ